MALNVWAHGRPILLNRIRDFKDKQKYKQIKKQLRCHIIHIRINSYLTTTKGILLKLLIAKWYDTCRFLLIPLLLVYLGTVRNKKKQT